MCLVSCPNSFSDRGRCNWRCAGLCLSISYVAVEQSPERDSLQPVTFNGLAVPSLCHPALRFQDPRDCYYPRHRRGSPRRINFPLMIDRPACLDSLSTTASDHCNPNSQSTQGQHTSFHPIPCSPVLGLASAGLVFLRSFQCIINRPQTQRLAVSLIHPCPGHDRLPYEDRGSVIVKQSTLMVIMHKMDRQLTRSREVLVQRPCLGPLFSFCSLLIPVLHFSVSCFW